MSAALIRNAGVTTRAGPQAASARDTTGTSAIEVSAATMNMVGSASTPKLDRKNASRSAFPATCSAIIVIAAAAAIHAVARSARGGSATGARPPPDQHLPQRLGLLREEDVGEGARLGRTRHVRAPPALGALRAPRA